MMYVYVCMYEYVWMYVYIPWADVYMWTEDYFWIFTLQALMLILVQKVDQGLGGNPIWVEFKRFSRTKGKDKRCNNEYWWYVLVFDEERNVVDATSLSLDFSSEVTDWAKRKCDGKPDMAVSAAITMYGPVNKHLSLKMCIKFDLQFNWWRICGRSQSDFLISNLAIA